MIILENCNKEFYLDDQLLFSLQTYHSEGKFILYLRMPYSWINKVVKISKVGSYYKAAAQLCTLIK
jgi:hypothetical protein